jgi:hypothetical protein
MVLFTLILSYYCIHDSDLSSECKPSVFYLGFGDFSSLMVVSCPWARRRKELHDAGPPRRPTETEIWDVWMASRRSREGNPAKPPLPGCDERAMIKDPHEFLRNCDRKPVEVLVLRAVVRTLRKSRLAEGYCEVVQAPPEQCEKFGV